MTITVRTLIEQLSELDDTLPVQVWLPGSRIDLHGTFESEGTVLIEGNLTEDSALAQ